MWAWPENIAQLGGGGIPLELLSFEHVAGLTQAASNAIDHEWGMGYVPRPEDMEISRTCRQSFC
jgi:hypothetical protein